MYAIVFTEGPRSGDTVLLETLLADMESEGIAVFGRGKDCALRIKDQHISSQHGHLRYTPDPAQLLVEDFGSSNGTFVNGHRISEATPLNQGDEIRAGRSAFVIRNVDEIGQESPVASTIKLDDQEKESIWAKAKEIVVANKYYVAGAAATLAVGIGGVVWFVRRKKK